MADKYRALRDAVLAYAAALKRYASFGSAWMEETPELDTLWDAVLRAAQPQPCAQCADDLYRGFRTPHVCDPDYTRAE
jgi:hypothetical protein